MDAQTFLAQGAKFFAAMSGLPEADVLTKIEAATELTEFETAYQRVRTEVAEGGHKKGLGKAVTDFKKAVKAEYGVELGDDVKEIPQVIKAIKESYEPDIDPNKITEKTLKLLPQWITLEAERNTLNAKLEGLQSSFDTRVKSALETIQVQTEAERGLQALGAVIPGNDALKKIALEAYRKGFEGLTKVEKDGQTYWFQGDKRVDNAMGQPLTFDDIVKERATALFELQGPDRGSAGEGDKSNPPGGGGSGGGGGGALNLKPTTKALLNIVLNSPTATREQKNQAAEHFDKVVKDPAYAGA